VLELDDSLLDVLPLDGMMVPRIRMTTWGLPEVEVKVGDEEYEYQKSFPIKGHSATLPKRIGELLDEGKSPLVIERPDRFYLYLPKSQVAHEA
jgi:hypothetical protein